VETAEEVEEKDSPPQTVEGVVEAWVVRAERLRELRLVLRLEHPRGVAGVALEAMGEEEVTTRKKVQEAAEVAAQSERWSTFPTLSSRLAKREPSRAVVMVEMRVASLRSGAPAPTRRVPAAVAVAAELVNPSRTYLPATTAAAATTAVVVEAGPPTAGSAAVAVLAGLVYWVALTVALEVLEAAGGEPQTEALSGLRVLGTAECLEVTEIQTLAAVAPASAERFLMTAEAST